MAYLFKKYIFSNGRIDKRTHGQTDERTNGRTVRLYYAPNFIWGHKNTEKSVSRTVWIKRAAKHCEK